MADIGDKVCKKGADLANLENEMTIEEIEKMSGTDQALCRYVKNTGENHGLIKHSRGKPARSDWVSEWIPLSELELVKVTVYYFKLFDIKTLENVRSKRPATRGTIAKLKGEVLENTAQEVDASRLDGNGFLRD